MAVLTKIQEALPNITAARESINNEVSAAKQNASDVLNSFSLKVLKIEMDSLHSIIKLEAETLAFGARYDPWCWENNVPMLQGYMGSFGKNYSECTMRLDNSVTKIIGNVFTDFYKREAAIIDKYNLFEIFKRRNIINDPRSIDVAFSNTLDDFIKATPELGSVITVFERYLNATLPVYSECLHNRKNDLKKRIERMTVETLECVSEMKQLSKLRGARTSPKTVPPKAPLKG